MTISSRPHLAVSCCPLSRLWTSVGEEGTALDRKLDRAARAGPGRG
jgi:hypothetical protein